MKVGQELIRAIATTNSIQGRSPQLQVDVHAYMHARIHVCAYVYVFMYLHAHAESPVSWDVLHVEEVATNLPTPGAGMRGHPISGVFSQHRPEAYISHISPLDK